MAIWLASCKYAGNRTNGLSAAAQKTSSAGRQRARRSRAASAGPAAAAAPVSSLMPPYDPCCRTGHAVEGSCALAEQSRRPPHQQPDHHQVNEEGAERREIVLAGDV